MFYVSSASLLLSNGLVPTRIIVKRAHICSFLFEMFLWNLETFFAYEIDYSRRPSDDKTRKLYKYFVKVTSYFDIIIDDVIAT